ncbi:MAG: glycosyltransferase family 2 protein [Lachnospiraceae bacterium]|nr:glycosyltransferase family 2 protein [Lachnospiraceae bacterium]
MLDLTVIVMTKNEEKNLGKCLRSLRGIAKRIVVVDSGSTDQTAALARKLGAEVFEHPFTNHAAQLNWGLENTGIDTKWVLRMDADEELTAELVQEIVAKLPALPEKISGIWLRRRVYFMGRWIRHGGVYPTLELRLFCFGKAVCEQRLMDEHMVLTEGEETTFARDFIDNNNKELSWWIQKHNWYSDREMADHLGRQKEEWEVKPRLFGGQAERRRWLKNMIYYRTPLMRRAHWYFFYRYILRGGFLDGKEGLMFHFLQGYWYRFLVDAKIFEAQKRGSRPEVFEDLKA